MIPTQVSGPGLLDTSALLRGRRLALHIACKLGGRVAVTGRDIGTGTLAHARYVCSSHRATVRLSLRIGAATLIARAGSTLAQLTFVQGGTTEHLSLVIAEHAQSPTYWSDGGLHCDTPGSDQAELVGPNFKVTPSTTIDVRPWVAWYTATDGWQWLGVSAANASRWYRWTATPDGVAEWMTPAGDTNLWTWGPIFAHPGQGTYAIAVFEVIYWYSHPKYVWGYAPSRPTENLTSTYCADA